MAEADVPEETEIGLDGDTQFAIWRMPMDEINVLTKLEMACKRAGSQLAWAKAHGISPAYLSSVLGYERHPGPKLLAALGLRKVISYEPVGRKKT